MGGRQLYGECRYLLLDPGKTSWFISRWNLVGTGELSKCLISGTCRESSVLRFMKKGGTRVQSRKIGQTQYFVFLDLETRYQEIMGDHCTGNQTIALDVTISDYYCERAWKDMSTSNKSFVQSLGYALFTKRCKCWLICTKCRNFIITP